VEVDHDAALPMGTVDVGGARREVCLAYVPDASVGEYVVVHVGFAIARVDEAEAEATLALLREVSPDSAPG
jgi:hydrogenase expression/formation protein HypC